LKSERPRREYDFYETPAELVDASINRLWLDEQIIPIYNYLDPGCGNGIWGNILCYHVPDANIIGIDINLPDKDIMGYDTAYDILYDRDYLEYDVYNEYDLIAGNPPYSLAEEFVRKSFELLRKGGYIFFLLRLAFLESKKRHFGLFSEFPPKRVYVLSRRPSFFSSNGKTKTTDALSYAMFLWQEGWKGKTELDWLYWEYEK